MSYTRITVIILLSILATATLIIGPYLPRPSLWQALLSKQQATLIPISELKLQPISVIIPSYNSGATTLTQCISQVLAKAAHPELIEIIVVDGGSTDNSLSALTKFPKVQLAHSTGGRGPAMYQGLKLASNEYVFMLHSDSLVSQDFDSYIQRALANPKVLLSAFEFSLDTAGNASLKRTLKQVAARSRQLWLPYGDQGFAARKSDIFKHMQDSFTTMPMMEDFALIYKFRELALSNNQYIAILPSPLHTSARRFIKTGSFKTSFLNWCFVTAFSWGKVSTRTIYQWYYKT